MDCGSGMSGTPILLKHKRLSQTNGSICPFTEIFCQKEWLIAKCQEKKYRVVQSAFNPDLVLDVKENALIFNNNNIRSLDLTQKWYIKRA
jgi:hypothetical protein